MALPFERLVRFPFVDAFLSFVVRRARAEASFGSSLVLKELLSFPPK